MVVKRQAVLSLVKIIQDLKALLPLPLLFVLFIATQSLLIRVHSCQHTVALEPEQPYCQLASLLELARLRRNRQGELPALLFWVQRLLRHFADAIEDAVSGNTSTHVCRYTVILFKTS